MHNKNRHFRQTTKKLILNRNKIYEKLIKIRQSFLLSHHISSKRLKNGFDISLHCIAKIMQTLCMLFPQFDNRCHF